MNISTLKEVMPWAFKANIPLFIWGRHGIGKSETVKQVADSLGWHFFDFRLNTQADNSDIIGLMDFERDSNNKIIATKHQIQKWLLDCIDFCKTNPTKGALLFFDELNRAPRYDMVGPIFQMSLDKRLHIWKFPENLKIVVAANPPTDDYNTLDLSDKALLDRFAHVYLEPTAKEFLDYARKTNCHENIVNFLTDQPSFIDDGSKETFSVDDYAKPSRRTWLKYLNELYNVKTPESIIKALMKSLVGVTASTAFIKFLENEEKPLTALEIVDDYKNQKKRVKKLLTNKSGIRTDLFKVSAENLKAYLTGVTSFTEEQGKNIVDFVFDLPADYLIVVLRDIYELPCCLSFFAKSKYKQKEMMQKIVEVKKGK